jgi:hypothetical protein
MFIMFAYTIIQSSHGLIIYVHCVYAPQINFISASFASQFAVFVLPLLARYESYDCMDFAISSPYSNFTVILNWATVESKQ